MAVRKINNWWYVDLRHNFSRYRKRSPENSKKGAQAYEVALRQRLAAGEDIDTPPEKIEQKTFEEFAWEWFETYVKANNKPSEQRSKETALRVHLIPAFGKLTLLRITSRRIEELKQKKLNRDGLAPQTVNNLLNVLSGCLRRAVDWELLDRMPTIKRLRVDNRRTEFLSEAEASQLLVADRDPMWRSMLLTALRTGMRFGELAGLEWTDVDLEHGLATVQRAFVEGHVVVPKSGKTRHVPLASDLVEALAGRVQPSSLVFHQPNGDRITHSAARHRLTVTCRRAGIRRVTWHVLRHTCASHLAMRGVPLSAIQQLLGHSSITVTERYAHLSPSFLSSVVRAFDQPITEHFGQHMGNELRFKVIERVRAPQHP